MDLEKAQEAFAKYVNTFDINNDKINLKIKHSYEVAKISKMLADSLNLTDEEVELATLIGLLHDIGRFYQLKITDSFSDLKFDHSNYGVMYLFDEGHIRDFINITVYDEIIRKAILYHNDFSLPDDLDSKKELFCKIIRDADKIDIFRVYVEKFKFLFDKKEVNPKVMSDFYNGKSILRGDTKSASDKVMLCLGFINDMYFSESFKILKDINYFNDYINSIEVEEGSSEAWSKIVEYCNNLIERRVKDVG